MAGLTFRFRAFLVISACLSGLLFSEEEQEDWITRELSFFSPFRPAPPALFYRNGEQVEQVSFPRTIHGKTVTYEGPEEIIFYTRTTDSTGEYIYEPTARVTLADSLKKPLLLVHAVTGNDNNPVVRVLSMDLQPEKFPAQSLTIVNLTGITMQGQVGDHQSSFPPGISDPVPFEGNNGTFPIALTFEFDGRIYPTFFNTVTLDPETRQWMFVGPPRRPGSHRARVRFIEDHSLLRRQAGDGS